MTRQMVAAVARVLDDFNFVINKGSNDGINEQAVYYVIEIGPMIKDPETNKDLEPIEIVKGKGRVVHLQSQIATIGSTMYKPSPRQKKTTTRVSPMIYPRDVVEEIEEPIQTRQPFDGVKIGDIVVMFSSNPEKK